MNWKTELQLSDFDAATRFEITCKTCSHTRYETQSKLAALPNMKQAYLNQVESALRCSARGCRSSVRLSLIHDDKNEGFVGGMA
jgi:hypothetical protein